MSTSSVRVKHASVFVAGTKVGTMHTNTLTVKSGDSEQTGDEGFIGFADGDARTSCQVGEFVPIQGTSFGKSDFAAALLDHTTLQLSFALLDGKIWEVDMRSDSREYTSDSKAGTQNAVTRLFGGGPENMLHLTMRTP